MLYCIRGTFGGDFNLVIWRIWFQSLNLMYAKSTYNHVHYEQCTITIILLVTLKSPPMCIMSQFAKLIVR